MKNKKVTTVKAHPRKVPVSKKNPTGTTIVDQHQRKITGQVITKKDLETIVSNYNKNKISYPTKGKLTKKYPNADRYDEIIAIWTDYFNQIFSDETPIEPDVIKALIGSESDFIEDPKGNTQALGIAQITPQTLNVLQDPNGEVKELIFSEITENDLKNPNKAIPMAIRWLFRKKQLAKKKLKRGPSDEETILEYKGLLKSRTEFKENALKAFRERYDILKK